MPEEQVSQKIEGGTSKVKVAKRKRPKVQATVEQQLQAIG